MNTKLLKEIIKKKGMTILSLSKECKLGYATCHDILSGKIDNPRVKTICKITEVLGLSIDAVLTKGGEKNEEESNNKAKK